MAINYFETYIRNPMVDANRFIQAQPRQEILPTFTGARERLPQPFWAGHESAVACYWKVWELALCNLRNPSVENGFVSPYIDTAFNDHLFMWDSAFILLFARYGQRVFNFQQTLDNFYAKQHPDGFICREIRESDGADCFKRFDPPATGPDVLPWTEWEYYQQSGNRERLGAVFAPLLAFHQWMCHYRTWPDGMYWASGWACGMDNQPRLSGHAGRGGTAPDGHTPDGHTPDGPVEWWDHDHMTWIDASLQALFSARLLARMADELGRADDAAGLWAEVSRLGGAIESHLWDEESGFYYDRRADGSLSTVKSVAAFWALLAGCSSPERLARLSAQLRNPATFMRPHRVPSLTADHPDYHPLGQYWRGGVWPPTNYMVLRGLSQCGDLDLAHEIGMNHHEQVVKVFEDTGTVWENYAPETCRQGNQAKKDFVGWSGLAPVAVLFETVFGLNPNVPEQRLVWDVRLLEEHGVTRYPFGMEGLLDLHCLARASALEKPRITVQVNRALTIEVRWAGGTEEIQATPAD